VCGQIAILHQTNVIWSNKNTFPRRWTWFHPKIEMI